MLEVGVNNMQAHAAWRQQSAGYSHSVTATALRPGQVPPHLMIETIDLLLIQLLAALDKWHVDLMPPVFVARSISHGPLIFDRCLVIEALQGAPDDVIHFWLGRPDPNPALALP